MRIQEICEFFWKTEKKYGLTTDPDHQRFWIPFRFPFYYFITHHIGTFETVQEKKQSGGIKWVCLLTRNPFFGMSRRNIIFPADRKVGGEDIYTSEIRRRLGSDVVIVETAKNSLREEFTVTFEPLHKVITFFSSYLARSSFFNFLVPILLRNVIQDFCTHFNIPEKKVFFLAKKSRLNFLVLEKLYSTYFRLRSFETLYIVGAYTRSYIVSAARKNGIKVIEIQHGVITPYHLGYSYPDKPKIQIFPNEVWVYGKFWAESTEMPTGTIFKIKPATFIKRLAQIKSQDVSKMPSIVFNSQWVLSQKLFEFSLSVAKLLPNLEVIFRLHPSEDLESFQTKIAELTDVPLNYKLSHKDPNIFFLLSSAEYSAGVFSTTLFEAMYLGAKVVLIDLPGVEYMRPVLERGEAIIVKTPLEFSQKYTLAKKADASHYYAENPDA